jgi:hypothetical protein
MSGSRRRRLAARAAVVLQVVLLIAALVGPSRVVASEPSDDPGASATPTEQPAPTEEPSAEPTQEPTPTDAPATEPTPADEATPAPTEAPSDEPTAAPTTAPTPIYVPAAPPTIKSDLPDYPPGATVSLTGSHWYPGEPVHIFVNDDWGSSWSRDADVVADEDGNVADQFDLPIWFVAEYRVVATGTISGIATTTFTDGAVRVRARVGSTNLAAGFAALSFKVFSNATCSGTPTSSLPTASFTTPTGGNGYANVTGLSVSSNSFSAEAPGSVTAGATTYAFASWTADTNATHASTIGTVGCFTTTSSGQISLTANYSIAPTAVADAATVLEDASATTIDVLANDTDPDGGAKAVQSVTQPANGDVTVVAGGTGVRYTPDVNYCNVSPTTDDFTYTLNGGSSATVKVSVTCVNDAPAGTNGSVTISEDASHTFSGGSFGFTDPNDSPANALASVVITTLPGAGSLELDGNPVSASDEIAVADLGDLVFTPVADANGTPYASFTFEVRDDGGTANGGVDLDPSANTFTINVSAVDDAPVAVADSATVLEDSGANAIDVLANDTDIDGGPKLVEAISQGAKGTVVITNGGADLTYEPDADACGTDSFDYTLNGGSSATVEVTITCVSDAPAGSDGSTTIDEDTTYTFASGDFGFSDPKDSPADTFVSVVITTLPGAGSLTLGGSPVSAGDEIAVADLGDLVFTPVADANGTPYASLTFQVRDSGTTANGGVNFDPTADTFTINVTPVNDKPVLDPIGDQSGDEGSLLTFDADAADVDGDTLTFSLAAGTTDCGLVTSCAVPSGASVDPVTGAFSWTPADDGTFRFFVVVTDDGTPVLDDQEEITITVDNVAPTATLGAPTSVDEGDTIDLALTDVDDPGTDDTHEYRFSCDDGATWSEWDTSNVSTCPTTDDGTVKVRGEVRDDDGGSNGYAKDVLVKNVAPTIALGGAGSTAEGSIYSLDLGAISDPGTDTVTQWIVDWGDSTAPEAFTSGGTKTHVYADGPASHTIHVDLVDEDGTHEDAGTKSISVTNVVPTATFGAPTEVDEGSTINLSLTSVVDPGTDTHEFRFSCDDGASWTPWSGTSTATCAAVDDGIVKVKGEVRDEDLDATTYSASVTVNNVAPTVPSVSITFDPVTHLAVATATYGDVGTADTHTATFAWSAGSPASVTKAATGGSVADGRTLPNGCYTLSVTVTITDDDDGATSKTGTYAGSADAYAISFEAPIKDNERNVTKWGNVVPIKVRIVSSCTGAAVTSPALYLTVVKGSYDNIDEGTNVMATSVSSADTDNRMRLNGNGYIYNLSTKGFSAGSDYTVRVRLGGTDGTIVQSAVLQPKK